MEAAVKKQLAGLLERGDLTALMVAVNQKWVDEYHPAAAYSAVIVHVGERIPDLQIPFRPASAVSEPAAVLVPGPAPGPCPVPA